MQVENVLLAGRYLALTSALSGGEVTSFIQLQNTSCYFISTHLANHLNFSYFSMYLNTFKLFILKYWVYLIKRIIPYSVICM